MIIRATLLALALGSVTNALPQNYDSESVSPAPSSDADPSAPSSDASASVDPTSAVNPSSSAEAAPSVDASSSVNSSSNADSPVNAPIPGTAAAEVPADPQYSEAISAVSMNWGYGQQKVRGVNLGGWLVLEPWITPSLFERTGNDGIVDEYTFCQYQDRNTAQAALKRHWDTWITEDDFRQIAAAGLNHVRLPIGYWAYDVRNGEPYISGQAAYVDKAVGWARNHGLKMMLELHGAPGSQNGFDNSGQRMGYPQWHTNWDNVVRAKNVMNKIANRYAGSDVITALGLLNEPATFYGDDVLRTATQYWYDGYGATRWLYDGRQSNFLIVISDGFQPISHWSGFMAEPGFSSVALDTHYYQVFSNNENSWDWNTHLQQACSKAGQYSQSSLWLLVGEWSLASTDCAQYLNGRGRGSRYAGQYENSPGYGDCNTKTGNGDTFSPEYKEFMRQFYDTQTQVFENNGQGWFYWCWKNERAADWSYQSGLRLGYIPRNPGDHKYPLSQTCR